MTRVVGVGRGMDAVQLPEGATQDTSGNTNVASNVLAIEWDGHNVRPGMTIAGEFVYWGQRVCLAPTSFTPISGPCPLDDTTYQVPAPHTPHVALSLRT